MNLINEFRAAIQAAGLQLPPHIEPGKFHRFPGIGKRNGNTAGWCKFFDDQQGGVFGDFSADFEQSWHAQQDRPLTREEQAANERHREAARAEAAAKQAAEQAAAAEEAARQWAAAKSALESHPYLQRKGIKPHKLRVDTSGRLLVPVRSPTSEFLSLQFIAGDGEKRFLPGGRIAGGHFSIGGTVEATLCIAEGYATAATIHEATGLPVAVAFSCGSLEPVARALAGKLPSVRLVLCADDDACTSGNPGVTKAAAAAQAVGGVLAVPDFGAERPDGATDFNDLALHRGVEAVRECIDRATQPLRPEPHSLPPEFPPVQSFDLELLPDSLRAWVADICERVQCPPDFVAVPLTVALGSLIGRKVRIRPKALDNWSVVPNVWGCVIGRPGTMKSPAVAEALQPLRKLEATARVEYEALSAEYEAQADFAKLKREAAREKAKAELKKPGNEATADSLKVELPDEPVLRRYTAHQSSVQALGELLRQNPNGLLVERDELASLLSSLSQEEQAEARGFYLTGADGFASYTFDTIGRGLNLRVPAVCLSLIGTTQPGKIGRYLRQAQAGGEGDDGLMQRFGLMVWPDAQAEWVNVDRWPDSDAKRRAAAVFERLDRMTAESVGAEQDDDCAFLRFAPEALEVFTEWRTAFERRLRSGELHPALESHFAKYRKTIPALALILHLADDGRGPVTLQATLRALAWAEYLESHAERCYGATVTAAVTAARRILARIRRGELNDGFKAREINRAGWSELTDADTVRAALNLLVAHGYLFEVELPATAAGGRPTLAYHIHPAARR